jgi:hypothetical protein
MKRPEKKLGPRRTETEAEKDKTRQFMQLGKRFRAANHADEIKRLGGELGRMIFGG